MAWHSDEWYRVYADENGRVVREVSDEDARTKQLEDIARVCYCAHGERDFKTGVTKTGKSWAAWFCPIGRDGHQDCKPQWVRPSDGKPLQLTADAVIGELTRNTAVYDDYDWRQLLSGDPRTAPKPQCNCYWSPYGGRIALTDDGCPVHQHCPVDTAAYSEEAKEFLGLQEQLTQGPTRQELRLSIKYTIRALGSFVAIFPTAGIESALGSNVWLNLASMVGLFLSALFFAHKADTV